MFGKTIGCPKKNHPLPTGHNKSHTGPNPKTHDPIPSQDPELATSTTSIQLRVLAKDQATSPQNRPSARPIAAHQTQIALSGSPEYPKIVH